MNTTENKTAALLASWIAKLAAQTPDYTYGATPGRRFVKVWPVRRPGLPLRGRVRRPPHRDDSSG